MAISAPTFSSSFCCRERNCPTRLSRLPIRFRPPPRRTASRLISSATGGFDDEGLHYELQHGVSHSHPCRRGWPVFVTLPADAVTVSGGLRRRKAMGQSFRALTAAGVEGVVMEVWWGLVEREGPRVYNWGGYAEIVAMARSCGLKVKAVMAFHQCSTGPEDPFWIPLPPWVLDEMDKDPELAYSDRFGRRNKEYVSLGCDTLPVLHGRSPIQTYADFMRSFRDNFRPFLGGIITGVQVGMGPAGELRYPSCPSQKLSWAWRSRELGEFQCYDKYMLASLNACAEKIGVREWANRGPISASNLMHDPENTDFFKADGSWNSLYGDFFLQWYSGMLLLHGERICSEMETIFRGSEIDMSGKISGIHWHYGAQSHPSELTAGYYNTAIRDGYLPIARLFGRYGFALSCACFEMKDLDEQQINPISSPEGFLRQLLLAARLCDVSVEGENFSGYLDETSFKQVVKMSKLYSDGLDKPSFSFNFVRMDKSFFEYNHWVNFTRFVRQMSDSNIFRAKLQFGDNGITRSSLSPLFVGGALAY